MFFTKLPYSSVFNLSEVIKAKDGLVISKNVCSSKSCDLTFYSFGQNEGITWQTVPYDLFLYVLQGNVNFELKNNNKIILEEACTSSVIFIEAQKEFQISGKKNEAYKILFIALKKNIQGGNCMFIKNFDQGKVVTLKNQIEFEEGTIVSKTLVNSSALTMTLFAFDKEQGVSTHAAPGDAFVVCLEGTAEIELNGTKLSIKEGESLIMPAGAPHALKALTPYKMLLTVVKA
jgi:quercetin dioxygenase-like cupin family protein